MTTMTRMDVLPGKTAAPSREELVRLLNDDLAREYQAAVMYTTYAAMVEGPYRPQLAALFKSEISGEMGHAQFLADKIAALGGTPTTQVSAVPPATEPREMLQQVFQAEDRAVQYYKERSEQAEAFGDIGLKVQLENIAAEETTHRDEVKRILDGWDRAKR
ncbi:MAG: ferritin-like domain-containing protein [Chloroflexota bacterium]